MRNTVVPMEDNWRTIEGAEITCEIIDYLQRSGGSGLTDLADEFDRSKSSIHAYLSTLVERKYVVKDDNEYRLSLRYLDLAEHVKGEFGNYEVIRSEVDRLANTTGEVAQFATVEQGDLVYVYKSSGESAVSTMSSIGSREKLHSTALGKAILSHMDEPKASGLIESKSLEEKTKNTITDPDALEDELAESEERGYAMDDEENIIGLRCVAAPVVLDNESVLGAVSVSGPSRQMTKEKIETTLKDSVMRAANVVQINTKFS